MMRRNAIALLGAVAAARTMLRPRQVLAAGASEAAPILSSSASVDVKSKYGLGGNNDPMDGAKIQAALDKEPVGARLVFAPGIYRTSTPLVMHKLQHIDATGAIFRGDFIDSRMDLLRVHILDAGGYRDARNLTIRGGVWFINKDKGFTGRHALEVNGLLGAYLPVLSMFVEGASFGGGTGQGIALYNEVGHSTITNNQIDSLLISRAPDANKITRNLIAGILPGVTLDLQEGAFCTTIEQNTIVCQNGALDIVNGSQVKFLNNQCEQPPVANGGVPSAHVVVRGDAYTCQGVEISGNNFGAGSYVQSSVYLFNAQDTMIDRNTFNVAKSGVDIVESPLTKWSRIGPCNLTRGARPAVSDPSQKLVIQASGVGAFGVLLDASRLALENDWTSDSFGFFKDLSGIVHFRGRLAPGKIVTGTRIGTLPIGYLPRDEIRALLPTDAGDRPAVIVVDPWDGGLHLNSAPPDMKKVYLGSFGFLSQWRTDYDPQP